MIRIKMRIARMFIYSGWSVFVFMRAPEADQSVMVISRLGERDNAGV